MNFTIWYDDQPNEIVDKINLVLNNLNISIEIIGEGDGFIKYEIKQN